MTEATIQQIRILLVDEQKILRDGLRKLLESRIGMRVVGDAGTAKEALALASREQPDIILIELAMGRGTSLDFFPDLRQTAPEARVLVLTGERDTELHQRAVLLGALGLVTKDQPSDVLFRAIERVHSGEAWLNHTMTANVIAHMSRPRHQDEEEAKIASLTEREREIVCIACQGYKNAQIAARLFISEATVRNHITSILSKLGLSDRFELAIYSYRHGLARPPEALPLEKTS